MKRSLVMAVFILLAVLAAFNLLLIRQNSSLQARLNQPRSSLKNRMDKLLFWLSSIPSPIYRLTVQHWKEKPGGPGLSLLVFLKRQECGACLEEAEVWERLYKKFSPRGFFVLGIVRETDSLWADRFSSDYELTFPMARLDSATLEYLGVPSISPFKVMVDSSHRVVYLSGPNSEPEEQKNFAEVAEKLCRAYLTP